MDPPRGRLPAPQAAPPAERPGRGRIGQCRAAQRGWSLKNRCGGDAAGAPVVLKNPPAPKTLVTKAVQLLNGRDRFVVVDRQ